MPIKHPTVKVLSVLAGVTLLSVVVPVAGAGHRQAPVAQAAADWPPIGGWPPVIPPEPQAGGRGHAQTGAAEWPPIGTCPSCSAGDAPGV